MFSINDRNSDITSVIKGSFLDSHSVNWSVCEKFIVWIIGSDLDTIDHPFWFLIKLRCLDSKLDRLANSAGFVAEFVGKLDHQSSNSEFSSAFNIINLARKLRFVIKCSVFDNERSSEVLGDHFVLFIEVELSTSFVPRNVGTTL